MDSGNDEDAVTMTMEQKGKRPAGTQVQDCQIVQAAHAANQAVGMETFYIGAASTRCQYPHQSWHSGNHRRMGRERRRRAYYP